MKNLPIAPPFKPKWWRDWLERTNTTDPLDHSVKIKNAKASDRLSSYLDLMSRTVKSARGVQLLASAAAATGVHDLSKHAGLEWLIIMLLHTYSPRPESERSWLEHAMIACDYVATVEAAQAPGVFPPSCSRILDICLVAIRAVVVLRVTRGFELDPQEYAFTRMWQGYLNDIAECGAAAMLLPWIDMFILQEGGNET